MFFEDTYLYEGSIHLGMFSFAMFFIWKGSMRETLESQGIPGNLKRNVIAVVAGFAAILLLALLLGIVSDVLGFNDQQLVVEKVAGLPWYILAAAAIVAPISEETFFRAFLTPRIGVLLSSLAFGLSHFAYGSVFEVVGATLIGIVFAVIYKETKSLVPSIAIHFVYNVFALLIMRMMM